MTRNTVILILRFIFLLLTQVLVLNNIYFFGHINPNIYILFVFLYPLKKERTNLLLTSFLLGLCVDYFSNSGGINSAATGFIAYIRLNILKLTLNKPYLDYNLFKLANESLSKIIFFVSILTFLHHFIVFSLEYFSWSNFWTVFFKSFMTSIFTIILSVLSILLFFKKKTKII